MNGRGWPVGAVGELEERGQSRAAFATVRGSCAETESAPARSGQSVAYKAMSCVIYLKSKQIIIILQS